MFVKRQSFLRGPEWPQANKRNNGTLTLLVLWGLLCPATVRHFINLAISLTVLDIFTKTRFSSDNVTQAKNRIKTKTQTIPQLEVTAYSIGRPQT